MKRSKNFEQLGYVEHISAERLTEIAYESVVEGGRD